MDKWGYNYNPCYDINHLLKNKHTVQSRTKATIFKRIVVNNNEYVPKQTEKKGVSSKK